MSGDVATVRQVISDAIGGLSGWTKSRWAPDLWGRDTDHVMHHAYVVTAADTTAHPRDGRQRPADGLLVTTSIEIQWAHRLRGDAQSTDYDAALDAEQDAIKAIKAITSLHVTIEAMGRRAALDGWVLGTIRVSVLHRYALQ